MFIIVCLVFKLSAAKKNLLRNSIVQLGPKTATASIYKRLL